MDAPPQENVTTIQPINERLLLKKVTEEKAQKIGSLIVPTGDVKQDRYVVLKCARATETWPSGVECRGLYFFVGKVVYIDKYKGVAINKDGVDYVIVDVASIVAYEDDTP